MSALGDDLETVAEYLERGGEVRGKMHGLFGGACLIAGARDSLSGGRASRVMRHMDRQAAERFGYVPGSPVPWSAVGAHDAGLYGKSTARVLRDEARRQGVTPKKPAATTKPVEKPTKVRKPAEKPTEKPGRKRPGGQAKPCIVTTPAPPKVSKPAKVSLPGVGVGQALDGLGRAVITVGGALIVLVAIGLLLELGELAAAVLAVVAAWLPLILTLAALGVVGYIVARTAPDVDWEPLARRVRFARHHVAARRLERQRVAQARDEAIAVATAAIPLGPATEDQAAQEWINRGLRNRRLDGYVAEPVRVHRKGAA